MSVAFDPKTSSVATSGTKYIAYKQQDDTVKVYKSTTNPTVVKGKQLRHPNLGWCKDVKGVFDADEFDDLIPLTIEQAYRLSKPVDIGDIVVYKTRYPSLAHTYKVINYDASHRSYWIKHTRSGDEYRAGRENLVAV